MPRVKGSKSKTTVKYNTIKHDKQGNEKSNSKIESNFIKAKKVKPNVSKSDNIIKKALKRGKPKKRVKHVLTLTDNLYITCNSHCYMLCEVLW